MTDVDPRFAAVEAAYRAERRRLDEGQITAEAFDAALRALMFESGGTYWMIGANSGEWYVAEGDGWVRSGRSVAPSPTGPPRTGPPPAGRPPVGPPPVPAAPRREPSTRTWMTVAAVTASIAVTIGIVVVVSGSDEDQDAATQSTIARGTDVTVVDASGPSTPLPEFTVPEGPRADGVRGDTLAAGEIAVTVADVLDPAPDDPSEATASGSRLVGVLLRVENTGASPWTDFVPSSTLLIDSRGNEVEFASPRTAAGPDLLDVHVRPGDVRSGWVTFELADELDPAAILFTEGGSDDPVAAFDVRRGSPAAVARAPQPAAAGVDEAITLCAESLETDLTVRLVQAVDPADPGGRARAGWHVVALQFEIANVGDAPVVSSASNMVALVDQNGLQYRASKSWLTGAGPEFDGDTLDRAPGEAATGWITIPVADGTIPLKAVVVPHGNEEEWAEFAL